MLKTKSILLVPVFIILGSHFLPKYLRKRDDEYHIPPVRSPEDLRSLGACQRNAHIRLSNETLDRLEKTSLNGKRPVGDVTLSYITTRCSDADSGSTSNNNNNNDNKDNNNGSRKEHLFLIHGTGLSSMIFTEDMDGEPVMWNMLREKGYDITAVDLRGHGLSEITEGPYAIDLHGADQVELIRTIIPAGTKVHCWGLSVGSGVCMSVAAQAPELVETLSGSGWAFYKPFRWQYDILTFLCSWQPLIRLAGMKLLSPLAEKQLQVTKPNYLVDAMKYTHMNGYAHTSRGWFHFDVRSAISSPDWTIPTLIMLPEYDQDRPVAHSKEFLDDQIQMINNGLGRIVEFPGYSHCMIGETGGAQKIADTLVSFMDENSSSRVAVE